MDSFLKTLNNRFGEFLDMMPDDVMKIMLLLVAFRNDLNLIVGEETAYKIFKGVLENGIVDVVKENYTRRERIQEMIQEMYANK